MTIGQVLIIPRTASQIQDGHFDIIVDIRSSSEYAEGHIEGAINMPLMTALERLQGCEGHKAAYPRRIDGPQVQLG